MYVYYLQYSWWKKKKKVWFCFESALLVSEVVDLACSGRGPAPPCWSSRRVEYLQSFDSPLTETSAAVWCSLFSRLRSPRWKAGRETGIASRSVFWLSPPPTTLTWWGHTGCRASSTGSDSTRLPQRRCEEAAPPSGVCCTEQLQGRHKGPLSVCMDSLLPGWTRCSSESKETHAVNTGWQYFRN